MNSPINRPWIEILKVQEVASKYIKRNWVLLVYTDGFTQGLPEKLIDYESVKSRLAAVFYTIPSFEDIVSLNMRL